MNNYVFNEESQYEVCWMECGKKLVVYVIDLIKCGNVTCVLIFALVYN